MLDADQSTDEFLSVVSTCEILLVHTPEVNSAAHALRHIIVRLIVLKLRFLIIFFIVVFVLALCKERIKLIARRLGA